MLFLPLLSACSAGSGATAASGWEFSLAALQGAGPTVVSGEAPKASRLDGRVTLPDSPLAGATITLSHLGENTALGSVTSDGDGRFSLSLDPAGLAGQVLLIEARKDSLRMAAVVSVSSDRPLEWDLADAVATASLRPRLDAWAQAGIQDPQAVLGALAREAAALRKAIAPLSATESASLASATPPSTLLDRVSPAGSEVGQAFTGTAALLAQAIRDRVSHGAPMPTGDGMGAFFFGGAFAPPVYTSSGGGGSAPAPTPTPPGLALSPQDGGFMDPTASETVHIGP